MIELKFHSPNWLNSLTKTSTSEPPSWYLDSNKSESNIAMLNLSSMEVIGGEDQKKTAFLKDIYTNENENIFFINKPVDDNLAEPVSYTFASSMLGQLLQGGDLVSALKILNQHYGIGNDDDKPNPDNDDPDQKHDEDEENNDNNKS